MKPASNDARADRPPFNRAWLRSRTLLLAGPLALAGACGGGGPASPAQDDDPPPVAPSVTITAPAPGTEVTTPGEFTITAAASDADGSVAQVEFFLDGTSAGVDATAPFEITVSAPGAEGNLALSAVATDDSGLSSRSGEVTVVVIANQAPAVSVLTPEEGFLYSTPGTIRITADATDPDGSVQRIDYSVDGQVVATALPPDFAAEWVDPPAGTVTLTVEALDDGGRTATATVGVEVFSQAPFRTEEQRLGDLDTCYGNPEVTTDGRYLVWFEDLGELTPSGRPVVQMWHCGIDPDTGNLVPPDCRGFASFRSTLLGRAYTGEDAGGSLYLGADEQYRFTLVRITGPTSGEVTTIDSLQDPERRGIYPSVLPTSDKIYVWWLKSIGGLSPGTADTVELRFVDLDDPRNERVIVSQDRPEVGVAPIDLTFVRWAWREPLITFGQPDDGGDIEVYVYDVSQPDEPPVQLTDDGITKVDPYPFLHDGTRFFAAGRYPSATNLLYQESDQPGGLFTVRESYAPPPQFTFDEACNSQSNEPFTRDGRLYTAFQTFRCNDLVNVIFSNTSEIWFTELLDGSDDMVRLSQGGSDVKFEPEPLLGTSDTWVYYTRYREGQDTSNACYELYRAETPLN